MSYEKKIRRIRVKGASLPRYKPRYMGILKPIEIGWEREKTIFYEPCRTERELGDVQVTVGLNPGLAAAGDQSREEPM